MRSIKEFLVMQRARLTLSINAIQRVKLNQGLPTRRCVLSNLQLILALFLVCGFPVGCGTTKFSDTGRTATEQLLISSAMEDLADEYDYSRLAGLKLYVKSANSTTDSEYLKSLIRLQLAANGALVKDTEEEADYIVEIAPGTVGTNRYDLMYGIPETTVPAIGTLTSATSIPEFALIKRTDQKALVKLVMWAYNKTTGAIIWQSGIDTKSAQIRVRWIFGAGPFTTATYDNAGLRLGADRAIPKTFGEQVSQNEATSIRTEAAYQELDEKALERLQKIREEGLANAVEEDDEQLETEEDSAKETSPAKSAPEVTTPDENTPLLVESTPTPTKMASIPDSNQKYELDLGYDSKINPGSVYIPPNSRRY